MWCISVVAKKLGCRLKIKLRRLEEGLKCPLCLLSHHRPKIQPLIAAFSAGEFRRQPALSDNTGCMAGADPENSERGGGKKHLVRVQHRSISTAHEHPWGDHTIPLEIQLILIFFYPRKVGEGGGSAPLSSPLNLPMYEVRMSPYPRLNTSGGS